MCWFVFSISRAHTILCPSKDLHVIGAIQIQTTRLLLTSNCLQLTYEREKKKKKGLEKAQGVKETVQFIPVFPVVLACQQQTTNLCRTTYQRCQSALSERRERRFWKGNGLGALKRLSTGDSRKRAGRTVLTKSASQVEVKSWLGFRTYKIWSRYFIWRSCRYDSAGAVIFSRTSACVHRGGGR